MGSSSIESQPTRPMHAIRLVPAIPIWLASCTPTCTILQHSMLPAALARPPPQSGSSIPVLTRQFRLLRLKDVRLRCLHCHGGDQMMPILARFRTLYEQTTIPLGRFCLRLGLTPDTLTLVSLFISGMAALAIARGAFLLGIVFILLMGVADMLDGA